MKRKVGVGGAKAGHKVVLKSADRSLGGISAMDFRWRKLVLDIVRREVRFYDGRCFVIHDLEYRLEPFRRKEFVHPLVGQADVMSGS
jgi:hypothetical protein